MPTFDDLLYLYFAMQIMGVTLGAMFGLILGAFRP